MGGKSETPFRYSFILGIKVVYHRSRDPELESDNFGNEDISAKLGIH